MRLKETRITQIAQVIVEKLLEEELIDCEDRDQLVLGIRNVIVEDLLVEDKLDEEVRELLRQHQGELDKRRLEYFQMFRLVKDKLIRERNLII